jgi:hydroxyethylthiazole kinase-like uncharacterized protein yjeF
MRVVSSQEMRTLDKKAIEELKIPSIVLMEDAGLKSAFKIQALYEKSNFKNEILIFCGKGNNAGDGLVVARHLITNKIKVRVFFLGDEELLTADAKTNLTILKNLKTKIVFLENSESLGEFFKASQGPFFIVDALLGTGLKDGVQGFFRESIELINEYGSFIIALDIPSGVQGDTGQVETSSIQATHTLSYGYPKLGHFLLPGAMKRGELINLSLPFPTSWETDGDHFLLTKGNTAPLLQERDKYGHKNSFGHCLLVGGSPGRIGAIVMASNSCLQIGTGLVTVASWQDSFPSLEVKLSDEIMNFKIVLENDEFIIPPNSLQNFSSIVVGPGLGLRPDGAKLLEKLLKTYYGPLVLDADALNLISEYKLQPHLTYRKAPTVLTPHPGEMSRLLNKEKKEILDNPIKAVREAVAMTNAVVLLKGPTTFIHSPAGATWLNHYPNDGMATAGSGDVLAGIVGGLLGQKMNPLEATKLAVFIHSLSGAFAAEERGHRSMTALHIIENIKNAFSELNSQDKTIYERSL